MTIIANPPYEYGNEITRAVLDNVDFDNYINLMPMSAYKKNGLYKHIVASTALPANAFKDASVLAHVAVLSKEAGGVTEAEAAILGYREDLQSFYRENLSRSVNWGYTGFDNLRGSSKDAIMNKLRTYNITPENSFMGDSRTSAAGLPVKSTSLSYRWNVLKALSFEDLRDEIKVHDYNCNLPHFFIIFKTAEERNNFIKWAYGSTRNLFYKLVKGLNTNGGSPYPAIPRVDWSRPWTDEQILRDYGYKPSEIKKILEN